mmetsp:Transcript_16341/g.35517  ORF Transcript_16341/g.35517 Transcript_16341/m.35517 type:complete len:294 (-) Transcript_16341:347-1228(-)
MASEEIHTLFVSGLPADVKERELYNLFRLQFPGYVGCRLQLAPPKPPAAFVTLDTQQACLNAIEALNGSRFDPESSLILRLELAKANSKPKRSRPDGEGGYHDRESKQFRGSDRSSDGYGGGYSAPMPYTGYMDPTWNTAAVMGMGMPAPAPAYAPYGGFAAVSAGGSYPPAMGAPYAAGGGGGGRGGGGSNPPCTTVFVANLSPTCTEDELKDLFARTPGFVKMRFSPGKPGGANVSPVAWVDFTDTHMSSQALNTLQGYTLPSGAGQDRSTGMRIEFARNKMGDRPGGGRR